jgi:transposase InsO family protein
MYYGSEPRGRMLDQWAYKHGVRLQFIEPGKPIQNAHIEGFNARLREECLSEQVIVSLDDARRKNRAVAPGLQPRPVSQRIGQSHSRGIRPSANRKITTPVLTLPWYP